MKNLLNLNVAEGSSGNHGPTMKCPKPIAIEVKALLSPGLPLALTILLVTR